MTTPRHIRLSAGAHDGVVRFLSGLHVSLEEGKTQSWVTITRTGSFRDPRYGEFEITRAMLLAMVANFDQRTYGQDIFIDVAHDPSKGAAAKVLKLAVEGDRLRALVEWTPYGLDAVKNRGYQYLSAEYHENWQDNERGARHGPVLLGAGLTVRPVIKRLDPVLLSEDVGAAPTLLHPTLQSELIQEIQMKWAELIKKLSEKLSSFQLADAVVQSLVAAAERAVGNVTEEAAALALMDAFEASGKQLAAAVGERVVKLDIALPSIPTGLSAEQVKKLLAEEQARQAEATRELAEKKAANLKLLTEAIGAVQGFDEALRRRLAEEVADLVTADMSADQVQRLAQNQIRHGNELLAAKQLTAMGFAWPQGDVRVSVDDGHAIKSLQEAVDRRLGLLDLPASRRYAGTGGQLVDVNKQFAERVLAQYDAQHGAQLHAEHKRLAAGDGKVSDVAIPAVFERTVIREALYQLVGLQFVDVGTLPFSASALIPYSYRDTTAAGRGNTRVYEGGSIPRAGVKQTSDTAYPIPQKIAFEVSDELRYLTGNGQLNWDAVAENQRNASRIIAEDLDKLIFDEQLNACDQYATTDVANEAVATADGAKTIFKLDNFPVVRPKKIYDLQGNQIGATLYGISISTGGTARTEWDGTGTQAPGLYWWLDYNLGEIHFVDKDGNPSAPSNTHAVVASYSYTTNVYKFDTDLGTDAVDVHWDGFLYRFGLRKAVIEDDRYYSANFFLASGTVHTQIEQAKQFGANSRRPGTDLMNDGNLGRIKDVPGYKSKAPGLNMGDQRVVLGERGQTRLRMMKPWTMGELQDQRDAQGRFVGKKEAYGDQFIVLHTPTPLKGALTSIVLYSASARVDR